MKRWVCLLAVAALFLTVLPAALAQEQNVVFLTVSQIRFGTVGESENVYAGNVPADQVTWVSEDPAVISVENGVLTAQGVGTAQITASYNGQTVSCTAECLAQDRQALLALPRSVLREPARIPAKVEEDPTAFFSDSALIGDSITYGLMVNETKTGLLGHPLFLCRKNIGVHNFLNHIIDVYYQGLDRHVEDAVAASGVKKAFFLLGMNDLGFQTPAEVAEKYSILIDRIQAAAPDTQLYLQTCLPAYKGDIPFSSYNASIDEFNGLLAQVAEEKGCIVIDVASYMKDAVNSLAADYTSDFEVHLNYEGSVIWMDVLRAYAYAEMIK